MKLYQNLRGDVYGFSLRSEPINSIAYNLILRIGRKDTPCGYIGICEVSHPSEPLIIEAFPIERFRWKRRQIAIHLCYLIQSTIEFFTSSRKVEVIFVYPR